LQILPRAGAGDRLDLRRWIPCIKTIEKAFREKLDLTPVFKLNQRSSRWQKRR
jgi:hypothetical protein